MLYSPFLQPYHARMNSQAPETPKGGWIFVSENLRRRATSGVYYGFAKRKGKQKSVSFKTTDQATAKRLLKDWLGELDRQASEDAANITFEELAAQWTEADGGDLKASSRTRRAACVKNITPAFHGLKIRHITAKHCDDWKSARLKDEISAATLKKEIETMRGAFRYATERGLIMRDPSALLKKPRVRNKVPNVPTREQFAALIDAIRAEKQGKGRDGANLVELCAYSGMRVGEATALRWRDVDFANGVFTVTGGERGTKNHEQRIVPIFPELLELLHRIQREQGTAAPGDLVVNIASAKKCIETACRKLNLPHFTHHSMRHAFGSSAMELEINPKAAAEWIGHKDGGALLLKSYAHLRMSHSKEQAKKLFVGVNPPAPAAPLPLGNADSVPIGEGDDSGQPIKTPVIES